VTGYLRIDGDEHALVHARLVWHAATSGGRPGIVFQVHAQGARTLLHLAAWAPGERIEDLSNQAVALKSPGPDAAVDGRFLAAGTVRFGRVRADRAVISLDAEAEDLDPGSRVRAALESDLRCVVEPAARRNHCLGCGRPLEDFAETRDEFVGGYRVRERVLPVLCPDCEGKVERPRNCPTCGLVYEASSVHVLADEDGTTGYTATCPAGHTHSGALPTPAA
jgi:hypothetical protein